MALHQTYTLLRKKHPQFIYKSFAWELKNNQLNCNWHFHTAPNLDFHPTLSIPLPKTDQKNQFDRSIIDWLVFNIGLVESLSYWKATASPEIIIKAGGLNSQQIEWWHKLLIGGMGEYFYLNKIEFTAKKFVEIVADKHEITKAAATMLKNTISLNKNAYLIPVGGGKDSIVSLELLKLHRLQNPDLKLLATTINPTQASLDVINQSGLNSVIVTRQLDPLLLTLNQQGYLNGHTPFSALLAFVSTLVTYLYNYQNIVLSNEQSANEGNVRYLGQIVNHQYSKSFAFEQSFRQYIAPMMKINYFSLLRPYGELKIAKLFSQLGSKYFSVFRSCNRGQKTNSWCGKCSKCLFAWTILFPYLGEQKLSTIFAHNLFKNSQLKNTILELIGESNTKPFDCVGTYEESKMALSWAVEWYKKTNKPLPALLQETVPALDKNPDKNKFFSQPQKAPQPPIPPKLNTQHFLTKDLTKLLQSYV